MRRGRKPASSRPRWCLSPLKFYKKLVTGPKRLGTFGDSYLYAMFLRWGLISDKPSS